MLEILRAVALQALGHQSLTTAVAKLLSECESIKPRVLVLAALSKLFGAGTTRHVLTDSPRLLASIAQCLQGTAPIQLFQLASSLFLAHTGSVANTRPGWLSLSTVLDAMARQLQGQGQQGREAELAQRPNQQAVGAVWGAEAASAIADLAGSPAGNER